MANYYATARSNYFAINDLDEWNAFCKKFELESIMTWDKEEKINLYGFICGGDGGVPCCYFDEEKDDIIEVDFIEELAKHLQKDWVAVIMETGHEKARYVIGYAIAVNSKGEQRSVSLLSIYKMGEALGKHVTAAEY